MYAVVEFMDEKTQTSSHELSVVPLPWLQKKDRMCYWPKAPLKTSISECIKNLTPYKKVWPMFQVFKVHLKTDTYNSAEQKLAFLIESTSDDQETTDSTVSFTVKGISDDGNSGPPSKRPNLNKDDIPEISETDEELSVHDVQSCSDSTNSLGSASTITTTSDHCGFEQHILKTLTKIQTEVENHSLILNELLRSNRKINAERLIAPPNLPVFPISHNSIFNDFNTKLIDNTIYDYMVRRLAAVGGANLQSQTRRILRYLLSDEVAVLYNWKGRDKLSFEKTTAMTLIYESAKMNFPAEEKNDMVIANVVKEWLKFAKTRINAKKN